LGEGGEGSGDGGSGAGGPGEGGFGSDLGGDEDFFNKHCEYHSDEATHSAPWQHVFGPE
jgi:hypothetical protein